LLLIVFFQYLLVASSNAVSSKKRAIEMPRILRIGNGAFGPKSHQLLEIDAPILTRAGWHIPNSVVITPYQVEEWINTPRKTNIPETEKMIRTFFGTELVDKDRKPVPVIIRSDDWPDGRGESRSQIVHPDDIATGISDMLTQYENMQERSAYYRTYKQFPGIILQRVIGTWNNDGTQYRPASSEVIWYNRIGPHWGNYASCRLGLFGGTTSAGLRINTAKLVDMVREDPNLKLTDVFPTSLVSNNLHFMNCVTKNFSVMSLVSRPSEETLLSSMIQAKHNLSGLLGPNTHYLEAVLSQYNTPYVVQSAPVDETVYMFDESMFINQQSRELQATATEVLGNAVRTVSGIYYVADQYV